MPGAPHQFGRHYDADRPHQGIANLPIAPDAAANEAPETTIHRKGRASGMLTSWERRAA